VHDRAGQAGQCASHQVDKTRPRLVGLVVENRTGSAGQEVTTAVF
jgi:hypothetical protein